MSANPNELADIIEELVGNAREFDPVAANRLEKEAAAAMIAETARADAAEHALTHETRIKCEAIADYRSEKARADSLAAELERVKGALETARDWIILGSAIPGILPKDMAVADALIAEIDAIRASIPTETAG